MKSIYELGKSLKLNFSMGRTDEKLKFSLFPYKGCEVLTTSLLFFLFFIVTALIIDFIFNVEIIFMTLFIFGSITAVILYIYPTQIYYLNKIMEYKKEMLNAIMRFSMYLSMKSNMEHAIYNSLDYTKGILKEQFKDILLKLERKEFISLRDAFKEYSKTWNQYSPEFVDSLKLLEVASLSSNQKAEEIMEESIDQILLSYNIEQKRSSEELTQKIKTVIMAGIMLPVMFLMLIPLVSVFMPDIIKASALFLMFNIAIPAFLFVNGLNFSAKRLQLSQIEIETSNEYTPIPIWIYSFAFALFMGFLIPALLYFVANPPSEVTFDSFSLTTIFFVWLIPAGISISIYIICFYYILKNQWLYNKHKEIEDDIPHLLNYFSTYLSLNVPMENIFNQIKNDYIEHGFKEHPSVEFMDNISFKLAHLKTNLKSFIKFDLQKISSIKALNEVIEQISAFGSFSLKEASRAAKRLREQRVNIVKLNDYILTLLSGSLSLIGSTITLLSPLLSAMAIIMSFFIVTFIKFLSAQLETLGNMGGGNGVSVNLIDVSEIISPVYLELIIGFYIVEVILILAMIKSNIKSGFSFFNIIKTIKDSQIGFLVFSLCLFGGYFLFKIMFADAIGVSLD